MLGHKLNAKQSSPAWRGCRLGSVKLRIERVLVAPVLAVELALVVELVLVVEPVLVAELVVEDIVVVSGTGGIENVCRLGTPLPFKPIQNNELSDLGSPFTESNIATGPLYAVTYTAL